MVILVGFFVFFFKLDYITNLVYSGTQIICHVHTMQVAKLGKDNNLLKKNLKGFVKKKKVCEVGERKVLFDCTGII